MRSLDIVTLFQQSNGFMWIGSDRGVSRFDGYRYIHFYFDPGEKHHISNNLITSISEDDSGNIWVGTEDGLNKIDPNLNVTVFNQHQGLSESWVVSIDFDKERNKLWLGTGYGFASLDLNSYQFEIIDGIDDTIVESTYDAKLFDGGNVLLIGSSNGLFKYLPDTGELNIVKDHLGKEQRDFTVVSLLGIEENVYFGTATKGLFKYHLANSKIEKINLKGEKKQAVLISISKDKDNKIWAGYYRQGLSIYDLKQKTVTNLDAIDFDRFSIPSNSVRAIYSDSNGFVWIGTKEGVSVYSHYQVGTRLYYRNSDPNSLSNNSIYQIYPLAKDLLALPTDKGINLLNISKNTNRHYPLKDESGNLLPFQSVWNLETLDSNTLFVGLDSGLHSFDLKSGKLSLAYQDAIQETPVYVLKKIDDSLIVSGDSYTGLKEIDLKTNAWKSALTDSDGPFQLEGNFAMAIAKKGSQVFLGTTDSIFSVNLETGRYVQKELSKSTQFLRAPSLVIDDNDYLWVATQGEGLIRLKISTTGNIEENSKRFSIKEGLPTNVLNGLKLVGKDLWVAGSNEIFKFDTVSFKVERFPSIFEIDGLSFSENAITEHEKDIYFGTNRGLLRIRPSLLTKRSDSQKVKIVTLESSRTNFANLIDDKKVIEFPYTKNDIRLEFTTFDYFYSSKVSYRYKLDGVDMEWNYTDEGSTNLYANLEAGQYEFVVEASTSDGDWIDNRTQVRFLIKQPWTFYLGWAVAIASIIGILFYFNERRKTISILDRKAHLDSLTGVANRYSFNKNLEALIDENVEVALILIDLDGFKEINDTHGHGVGDQFLIESSVRLTHVLREHDFIARLGGDEFSVIISKHHDLKYLNDITERIRQQLSKEYHIGDLTIVTSASIGVSRYPSDSSKPEALVTCADAAMYEAKRNGRNLVCFYNQHLDKDLNLKLKIRAGLRTAIDNQQLSLVFQPKVDLVSKKVKGVESLLRWHHPEEGFISPAVFIPEAESSRQIIDIGYWVIEMSCKALKSWNHVDANLNIAINVSPIQITQPGFVQKVDQIIKSNGVDPKRIELEITEFTLVENSDACRFVLNNLKATGVTVALDDFGVGYSSFSYLTQFPIDTLKIDKSFVDNLETVDSNRIVLKHIINLTRDLEMKVVAEGVEDEGQVNILSELKADMIQGYFFSPPLSEEKLIEYIKGH